MVCRGRPAPRGRGPPRGDDRAPLGPVRLRADPAAAPATVDGCGDLRRSCAPAPASAVLAGVRPARVEHHARRPPRITRLGATSHPRDDGARSRRDLRRADHHQLSAAGRVRTAARAHREPGARLRDDGEPRSADLAPRDVRLRCPGRGDLAPRAVVRRVRPAPLDPPLARRERRDQRGRGARVCRRAVVAPDRAWPGGVPRMERRVHRGRFGDRCGVPTATDEVRWHAWCTLIEP